MLKTFFCSLILAVAVTVPATADIILSLDAAGGTNANTGAAGAGKTIDFFIGQDAGFADNIFVLVADFELEAGAVTGGTVSSTGPTAAPGFFGAGNLSTSSFAMTGPTSFNINQETTSGMQPLLNSPANERWFSLELDTTGLPDDVYSINLRDPAGTFADPGFSFINSNNNLTFTVNNAAAVPEPGSLAGLAAIAGICFVGRRSRRKRKTSPE